MPLKIIAEEVEKAVAGKGIKKSEIVQMMLRYKVHTGKRDNPGGPFRDHSPVNDTKSAWFPLKDVLDLFIQNGAQIQYLNVDDFGLRIYFGMHHPQNTFQPEPAIPGTSIESYYFKDTPIFVLTKRNNQGVHDDQLGNNNFVTLGAGEGLDNARLCPPECNGGM